jgi:hypothetical protein
VAALSPVKHGTVNGVPFMDVEVHKGHMVKADGYSEWADSHHRLWEVAPNVWRENITDLTLAG